MESLWSVIVKKFDELCRLTFPSPAVIMPCHALISGEGLFWDRTYQRFSAER